MQGRRTGARVWASAGTSTTWLARAGEHSATLHDHWVRHLTLPHLQLDELRTRLRQRAHVLWRWVALDPLPNLIPVRHLGPEGRPPRMLSSTTSGSD